MIDEEEEAGLLSLKRKIRLDRGFDCDLYKDKCLRRRLAVRMRARGFESFAAYADFLDQDPAEYDRLIDTLTINVTKFFRNPETWDVVASEVVPRLFSAPEGPVGIWSAGCASGEEPYSISILLHEWAERQGRREDLERVSIVGTDIDRRSLEAAEQAEYQELSFGDTSPERMERWFHNGGARWTPRGEIRRHVGFVNRDLIVGEPLRGQRLIVCRNVIIYFERPVQEKLFETFYDSLLPGGFLVLGRVETLLGTVRGLFRPLSTRERIYWKPG
jgi:chemotaxis protein methyltransferase CheR